MKMQSSIMAGIGSVFMILIVFAFSVRIPHGFMTKIAVKKADCGDGPRTIVIHGGIGGQTSINGEAIKPGQLESRLHRVFSLRAERLVFLSADRDVAFAEVVPVLDLAHGQVDHVALLTSKVQNSPGTCLTINMPPAFDYYAPPPPAHMKEIPIWQIWRRH